MAIKLNNKAMETKTVGMVLALILFVLLLLLMMFPLDNIRESMFNTVQFSSCEKGSSGVYGMCSIEEYCKSSENPAAVLGGCPSDQLKNVLDGINPKEYDYCCMAEQCSDVHDRKANEALSYPREKVNFKLDENVEYEDCLGFASDCKKEDDCCCISTLPS